MKPLPECPEIAPPSELDALVLQRCSAMLRQSQADEARLQARTRAFIRTTQQLATSMATKLSKVLPKPEEG